MSSARLPGKVLTNIAGKPLIQHLLERLKHSEVDEPVVVATSDEPSDDGVAQLAKSLGVEVCRGALDDVSSRFENVIAAFDANAFIRISGDSPFLDVGIVQRAHFLFKQADVDLVTNVFPRTFPAGQSVEIVSAPTFLKAIPRFDARDREHVTTYFYRNSAEYRVHNFESELEANAVHLAVDTEGDLQRMICMASKMTKPSWKYGLAELIGLYRSCA